MKTGEEKKLQKESILLLKRGRLQLILCKSSGARIFSPYHCRYGAFDPQLVSRLVPSELENVG